MEQEIRFCTTSDGVRLAYATAGEGRPMVRVATWLSHLEFDWRSPIWRHWLEELAKGHLLVRYDARGCGLSDWKVEDISFDAWVRDLELVVDTLGLERFVLLGISQGGAVSIEYTVRHPERVSQLVLYGIYARGWAKREQSESEERRALLTLTKHGWGRDNPAYRQVFTTLFVPGATPEQMRWFNDLQRKSMSPENAVRFQTVTGNIDVLERLHQVTVPTLVLHSRDDAVCPFEEGRQVAALIPNARFVTLESRNHILLREEPAWETFVAEVRRFLGIKEAGSPLPLPSSSHQFTLTEPGLHTSIDAVASAVESERPNLLHHTAPDGTVTILFTDIEGSTAMTERLGDQRWLELLRAHNAIVREQVAAHGGFEVKSQGDGFMVVFSSAHRALQCAIDIERALAAYCEEYPEEPLRVRIGLNTGEAIKEADDFFGKAVILAARIADNTAGGEILASDVVRQLVAGKGFLFADRGETRLRGFEDPVRLYEVSWE